MKMRLNLLTLALLAGCSSNPQMSDGDVAPVPVSAEQRLALARSGQSVVFEGYVYNGVVVTPSRNYYYGQTDGYPRGEEVKGDCFISEESAKLGGEVMPECAPVIATAPIPEPVAERPLPVAPPVPMAIEPPMRSSGNAFYDDLLSQTMRLDPSAQSDLMNRTLSFANAPTPRFAAGSAAVTDVDRSRLGLFSQDIQRMGEGTIVLISGFTSSEGPADLNDSLSKRRASAVRQILVNNGARSDFMLAFAAPQCCYLNQNRTPAERSANRRVELHPGGRYADSGSLVPQRIAIAIARMRKHMGSHSGVVRVHVQAGNLELARKVMQDVRSVMNAPEVGFQSIEEGIVSYGDSENVIIEVKS